MSRYRREVEVGVPHHIVHRGNHRMELFESDDDRRYYLSLLHRFSRVHELRIAGFCLMTNHVHVIGIPDRLKSLSRCIGVVHRMYSEHLNRRRGAHGSNWEGRYYSVPMQAAHALNALRYVERNPVEAGAATDPVSWTWSSAGHHAGAGQKWRILNADVRPPEIRDADWRKMLQKRLTEKELHEIRWAVISVPSATCVTGGHLAVPADYR